MSVALENCVQPKFWSCLTFDFEERTIPQKKIFCFAGTTNLVLAL